MAATSVQKRPSRGRHLGEPLKLYSISCRDDCPSRATPGCVPLRRATAARWGRSNQRHRGVPLAGEMGGVGLLQSRRPIPRAVDAQDQESHAAEALQRKTGVGAYFTLSFWQIGGVE